MLQCVPGCASAMMRTRTGRNLFVQVSQQMVCSNVATMMCWDGADLYINLF